MSGSNYNIAILPLATGGIGQMKQPTDSTSAPIYDFVVPFSL